MCEAKLIMWRKVGKMLFDVLFFPLAPPLKLLILTLSVQPELLQGWTRIEKTKR